MRTLFSFFFSLFLLTTISAQKKAHISELDLQRDGKYYQRNHMEAFTGIAFEDYPSGRKKSRAEFKDGKIHGTVTQWHEKTREKASVVNYKMGEPTGTETHWYPTGVKKLEIAYLNGVPHGVCREWYENEKLKSEGSFENGMESGEHKWFYLNGKVDQVVPFIDGKAHGKIKHYFPDGKRKMEADYKDGLQDGKVILYYESGKKKRMTEYRQGLENGKDLLYSKRGLLLEERTYTEGEETDFKNYRSAAIKTKQGYLQVFNEKESFFTIHLNQGWVRSRKSREITYVIDDFVLQLYDVPVSGFYKGTDFSSEDILNAHMAAEKAIIEKNEKTTINPESKFETDKKGNTYVIWSFDSPSGAKETRPSSKTVVKEHYASVVCGKRVLMLYVPQTKANNESEIKKTLKALVNEIRTESERIDLNQRRMEIRENAGLPPLPQNETFRGYPKNEKRDR